MKTPGMTGAVLGVAAVFGISWMAAIAYWRLGTRVPGPGEITGLMLGMPATLTGVLAWWRRREPRAPADPTIWEKADALERTAPAHARFAIRAAALHLPLGNNAADVISRAQQGTGLGLHPRLRDPSGFGVLAAEVSGLDTGTLEDELAAGETLPSRVRPELARALALADPVLEQLLATSLAPPVACGLLLPAHWSEVERERARSWFGQRLAAACPPHPPRVAMFALASGHELFGLLRSALPVDDLTPEGPRLWLAVSSNVGADSVARWARRGTLLGAGTPQGRAPGEAAAGLVLDRWREGHDGASLRLPDPTASSAGPDTDAGLATRLGDALSTTGIDADGIGLVVTDVDHHAKQCARLAALTSKHLPHLDPALDVVRLGHACGYADAALALASIALCTHAANDSGQAALAVGSHDTEGPALVLVTPPAPSP